MQYITKLLSFWNLCFLNLIKNSSIIIPIIHNYFSWNLKISTIQQYNFVNGIVVLSIQKFWWKFSLSSHNTISLFKVLFKRHVNENGPKLYSESGLFSGFKWRRLWFRLFCLTFHFISFRITVFEFLKNIFGYVASLKRWKPIRTSI